MRGSFQENIENSGNFDISRLVILLFVHKNKKLTALNFSVKKIQPQATVKMGSKDVDLWKQFCSMDLSNNNYILGALLSNICTAVDMVL